MASSTVAASAPTTPLPAALLDQLGQFYLLLDVNGAIVEVNDTFLTFVGYNRAQVLGQFGCDIFTAPAERAAYRQQYLDAIASETVVASSASV